MARTHRSTSPQPGRRGSLGTGIVIGALIGVCAALGIALYLNRADVFVKNKPKVGEAAAVPKVQGMPADPAKSAPPQKQTKAEDKQRFDFYNILPGKEEPKVRKDRQTDLPGNNQEVFYLQAGSFQNSADADNLKARLALAGIEAQIQSATLPNNKVWHRVRVGPYASIDDLNKAKIVLKENHIDTKPLTVRETAPVSN